MANFLLMWRAFLVGGGGRRRHGKTDQRPPGTWMTIVRASRWLLRGRVFGR